VATGLLERDGVLTSMEGLLGRAGKGVGGAMLIHASAGMGKTALLDEVRRRAAGVTVLAGRGMDLERDFPLGVVRQLLEPALHRADRGERERWLSGAAAVADPVLRGEGARPVEEGTAFNALYWVVAAMSADRPVMLTVDDVHWCDLESLRWIGFLVRRLEHLRLAVLLATRPPEVAAPDRALTALQEDPHVGTVALEPLSATATGMIVRAHLGEADDAFVAACREATGGNPFLLGQLLEVAVERGLPPIAANAHVASLTSAQLQRAVLVRLTRLGEDALAVARATAVLGGDVSVSVVAAFADMPLPGAVAAAEVLQRAELFAVGRRLSFRHALLRAAVLAGLGEVVAAAAHQRAARVLKELDATAEEIAAHLLASEPVGEAWAAEVLEQAAREALARASPRLAARLLERALKEPVSADRRGPLQAEMGGALVTAGDERGIDALLRAAEGVQDPLQRAAVAVRLAIPMWSSGRTSELPRVLDDARVRLPAGHPELDFRIAAVRAQAAGWGSGEPVTPFVATALALLPEVGEDRLQTRLALALLAMAALYANRPAREIAGLARRALGDPDAHRRAITAGTPLMPAVMALHFAEDDEGVPEAFARVEAGQRARGALAVGLSSTLAWRAICHVRRGALLDAQADAEMAIQTTPADGFAVPRNIATAALARVHAERGFPDRSLTLVDAQLARCASRGGEGAMLVLERARALRALRRPREAVDVALAVGAEAQALGYEGASLVPWPAVAAEALLELGDSEHAASLASRAVELAERFGAPGPIGCALRVRGLAEHDLECLRTAERALAGSPMRLEHARSMVELGAALRRDGQRAAAREPLAAGMELAHRCAADALVARAHEELLAAGARPRSVVRSGVEALTASELRAARLAAEGLTNREIAQHLFVTQKTIETQLRAVYRKLDVAGRRDLPAALGS
jgi:DNA-binding CsgD family transcriptional regulator